MKTWRFLILVLFLWCALVLSYLAWKVYDGRERTPAEVLRETFEDLRKKR